MASPNPIPLLTGGCQCGAIRYALSAPPERVHLCHCRMCQKAVGGPFGAFAPVRRRDFRWLRGTPASFASSSLAARDFCAACGTPLAFRYTGSEWIGVTIGSLDRPQQVTPEKHYGVENRLDWVDRVAALPTETTEAAMSPERKASFVNHQHPDHDTPSDWAPRR
jgi:hypothetical protein